MTDNSEPLRVIEDRHLAGDHVFTAPGLFLSLHLGHNLALEQRTEDALWSGRSLFGDLKVMLPGETRSFRHTRAARFAHFTLHRARLQQLGVWELPMRPQVMLRDLAARHLVLSLLAASTHGPSSRLFQDAMSQALIARLVELDSLGRASPRRGLDRALLQRVLERLEDELARDLSVADLAQVVGLSPSHFAARFTEAMGEPPHRYQIRRRVERARDLIVAGSSATEAALAVGFYDQSHLARHMRKQLGTTPAALRRRS